MNGQDHDGAMEQSMAAVVYLLIGLGGLFVGTLLGFVLGVLFG